MIDLNNEEFDSKGASKIFNGGKAGIVFGNSFKVEKNDGTWADRSPDYKVIYTDVDGGEINRGFYYPDAGKIKAMGILVKHIYHVFNGKNEPLPSFTDEKQMVDAAMKLLKANSNKKVNISTNYGSGDAQYQKSFMEVRNFAPFMEVYDGTEETSLFNSKGEFMERKAADEEITFNEGSGDAGDDGDEWGED